MFNKHNIILAVLAIIFFVIYSWHGIIAPQIYNSPDETANYFFIQQFVKNGDFFSPESLNIFLNNNLHPRSILYNGFSLVPQGFIGLPLFYGILAKIFSLALLKFFTPLLAVLGALAFYGTIRKIFNQKIAFLSLLLLLIFPIYGYYSARYLYPNVPGLALFLIAVWALYAGALHKEKSFKYLFVFAPALAISLAIRPTEAFWMLPVIICGLIVHRKNIDLRKVFYALAIIFIFAIPVLKNNLFLYGSVFSSGYGLDGPVFLGIAGAVSGKNFFSGIELPFGFNILEILKNVYTILIGYFWWYSVPAIFGFVFLLFDKIKKEEKTYILSALFVSAWLIFFYGSGMLADNPNIGRLTIGDSHFRYWLPVFVLIVPFGAFFWTRILEKLKLEKILLPAVLIFIFILSFFAVYYSVDDGLQNVAGVLKNNYQVKTEVLRIVPEKGIIVTGRQDKIFFPERKVIYAEKLQDNKLIENLSRIPGAEFYYYGLGLNAGNMAETDGFLRAHGFRLERVRIFGKEVLYKIIKK